MFRKRKQGFKRKRSEKKKLRGWSDGRTQAVSVIAHEDEEEDVFVPVAKKKKRKKNRVETAVLAHDDGEEDVADGNADRGSRRADRRRRREKKKRKKKRANPALFAEDSDSDSRRTRKVEDLFSGRGRYTQAHLKQLKSTTKTFDGGDSGASAGEGGDPGGADKSKRSRRRTRSTSPPGSTAKVQIADDESDGSDGDLKQRAALARQQRRRKHQAQQGKYIATSREEMLQTKLGQSTRGKRIDRYEDFDKEQEVFQGDAGDLVQFGAYKEKRLGGHNPKAQLSMPQEGFTKWEEQLIKHGSGKKGPDIGVVLSSTTKAVEKEGWNVHNRYALPEPPSEIRRFIQRSIAELKENDGSNKISQEEIELKSITEEVFGLERTMGQVQAKFDFFKEVQDFAKRMLACLADKAPMVEAAEQEMWEIRQTAREQMDKMRNRNYLDEWQERFNPVLLDAADYKEDFTERTRRMQYRERRAKRRKTRAAQSSSYHPGWSSDEEDSVVLTTHNKLSEFFRDVGGIFDNVDDTYKTFNVAMEKISEWREKYRKEYKDAWVPVSFGKLCKPYVRCELLTWDPFKPKSTHDTQNWYQTLQEFSDPPDEGKAPAPKSDEAIIPTLTAKVVLPTLTELVRRYYNPFSQKHTDGLMDELDAVLGDMGECITPVFKKRGPERLDFSRQYLDLVRATLSRLEGAVEKMSTPREKVFLPRAPKQGEGHPSFMGDPLQWDWCERRWWRAIKLLRNIVVFQFADFNVDPLRQLARQLFHDELKPLLSRVSKFPKLAPLNPNNSAMVAKFDEMTKGLKKALDQKITLDDVIS